MHGSASSPVVDRPSGSAALNGVGTWGGVGRDPRPVVRNFLFAEPGFASEFAVLVQNTCRRLFGLDLPNQFLATLSCRGSGVQIQSIHFILKNRLDYEATPRRHHQAQRQAAARSAPSTT